MMLVDVPVDTPEELVRVQGCFFVEIRTGLISELIAQFVAQCIDLCLGRVTTVITEVERFGGLVPADLSAYEIKKLVLDDRPSDAGAIGVRREIRQLGPLGIFIIGRRFSGQSFVTEVIVNGSFHLVGAAACHGVDAGAGET